MDLAPYLLELELELKRPIPEGSSLNRGRACRFRGRLRQGLKIMKKRLPSIAYEPFDSDGYKNEFHSALDQLAREQAKLREIVLWIWRELARRVGERAGEPIVHPRLEWSREGNDFIGEDDFILGGRMERVMREFGQKIASSDTTVHSPDYLYGISLISGVLNGSVLNSEKLLAYAKHINHKATVYQAPPDRNLGLAWVEISYETKKLGNVRRENAVFCESRVFLSSRPLSAVMNYWACGSVIDSAPNDSRELWKVIQSTFKEMGIAPGVLNSLSKLLNAVSIYFVLAGKSVSQSLLSRARGQVCSVGLRHDQWHALLRPSVRAIRNLEYSELTVSDSKNGASSGKTLDRPPIDARMRKGIKDIRHAIAEKNVRGGDRRRSEVIGEIEQIDKDSVPFIAGCLVDYYYWRLSGRHIGADPSKGSKKRKIKVSTLNSDIHGKIGYRLLRYASDWKRRELTTRQIEKVYALIIDEPDSDTASADIETELNKFTNYIRTRERDFGQVEVSNDYRSGASRVRTGALPIELYQAVRGSLQSLQGLTKYCRLALVYFWDLEYWLGARPEEVATIRVGDADSLHDVIVSIASNAMGGLKTTASPRNLPLAVLLPTSIRWEVEEWICDRNLESAQSHPLFESPHGEGIPWSGSELSSLFSSLIRKCGGVSDAVLYDARHTRISAWDMLAHNDIRLAVSFGFYQEEHAQEIVDRIFGGFSGTAYSHWQLAEMSGHASPRTPHQSYCHFGGFMMAMGLAESEQPWSAGLLSNFLGWTPTKVTRVRNAFGGGNEDIPAPAVMTHLIQKVARSIPNAKVRKDTQEAPVSDRREKRFDHQLIKRWHELLKDWSKGDSAQRLAVNHGFELADVGRVIGNIEKLYRITTRKGTSRLGGKKSAEQERTIPPFPGSANEVGSAREIIECLAKLSEKPRWEESLKRSFEYFLGSVSYEKTYISFYRKSDLRAFLKVFDGVCDASRWRAELFISGRKNAQTARDYWSATRLTIRSKKETTFRGAKNPHGILRLSLLIDHSVKGASKQTELSKKNSMELKYIIPMVVAITGQRSEIEALCNEGDGEVAA